jgi:flagellar basal body rod protein FlgG
MLNAQVTVDSLGRFGIVTSNPKRNLHVAGNSLFTKTDTSNNYFSAPYIIGHNFWSSAKLPDYTWCKDSMYLN